MRYAGEAKKKLKCEENKCNLIADMIRTELNRVNKGADISEEEIIEKSSEAQDALYGSSIKKCRVVVAGLDRKDLNGRKGSIRHWDGKKEQFCVGLDTKKSRDCDVHFFKLFKDGLRRHKIQIVKIHKFCGGIIIFYV